MYSFFRQAITVIGIALISQTGMTQSAETEAWEPTKNITIIAPANPGGGWDQTARFLQLAMRENNLTSRPVEVTNRGGAGGTIGLAELVGRYEGDPHKLLIGGYTLTGAVLIHDSKYSLLSTTPIARLTSEYQVIAVPADSPYQDLDDLIDAFRADPTSIVWGGGSAGGADHIFVSLLAEKVDVDPSALTYVAFTGGGEAAAALMGGQVTAGSSGYGEWRGLVESGHIRILAISSSDRIVSSEIPTLRELGIDLIFENWRCIVAAPGISEAERQALTELVERTRNSQSWQDTLERNQWQDSFLVGAAFEDFIRQDSETTKSILTRMGLGAGGQGYAIIGPYLFPKIIGFGLLASFLFCVWVAFRDRRSARSEDALDNQVDAAERPGNEDLYWFMFAAIACLAYAAGLTYVGFIWATPPFIVVLSRIIGSRSVVRDSIIAVLLTFAVVMIFTEFLGVDIP